jgi:hyperosmotically inducible protein
MNRRHSLNRTLTAILAVALMGAAAVTRAAETRDPGSPDFSRLDADRDGYVSRDEAKPLRGYDQAFSEADDNRDGKLDAAEFTKAQSIHDRETVSRYVDDGVITARVKAALLKDLKIKSFSVSVETRNGAVLLSGFVDDQGEVKRAEEIASGVQGVISVKNDLSVKS